MATLERMRTVEAMVEWPLLLSLPDDDRRRMLAAGRRGRYERREVIFHEGDPGDTLHFVERGYVAVRIVTPMGDTATLAVIGPGGTFGELSVLGAKARRSATVIALEPTETWSIHRDQFDALRAANPAVNELLLDTLASHVRRLSEQLVEALYLPANKRVVRRLLALTPVYGRADIPVTQDDLGMLAGASRATVNRVLGELAADGAIAVARGRIAVTDRERLARAARLTDQ